MKGQDPENTSGIIFLIQKEKKSIRREISLPLNLTGSDGWGMKTSPVLHRSSKFLEQLERQVGRQVWRNEY